MPHVLTFDPLLQRTEFVPMLRRLLSTLQAAYRNPVDIEFTANLDATGKVTINLVQCRPLQIRGAETVTMPPLERIAPEDTIITAHSAVVGQSRIITVDTFIYVVPAVYGMLPIRDRHEIASLLGRINLALKARQSEGTTVLLGPGRWGTSSPSLGVPVNFADINGVSVIGEIVAMHDTLVPDVSLGTHFLSELVEMDMLYLAIFPDQDKNMLKESVFMNAPNLLHALVPGSEAWASAVKVVSATDLAPAGRIIVLAANAPEQHVTCFLASPEQGGRPE